MIAANITALYHEFSGWTLTAFHIVLAVITALCISKLYESKLFNKFVSKVNYKSLHTQIWRDIIDYDLGTHVNVYLKDKDVVYTGSIIEHEENGNDSWIALSNYIRTNPVSKEICYDSTAYDLKTIAVVSLRDIDSIELFYDDDTKLFECSGKQRIKEVTAEVKSKINIDS